MARRNAPAPPTPAGLDHAEQLAVLVWRARNDLRLCVRRYLEFPDTDVAAVEAWARSLTTTNCGARQYDVAQIVLEILDRPVPAHGARGEKER